MIYYIYEVLNQYEFHNAPTSMRTDWNLIYRHFSINNKLAYLLKYYT